jgi:N-acylneuraminate cytidylyltransferase
MASLSVEEEPRKRTLAVITARGGSKRIPRKNIRNFLGQPIIKYSIDAARGAGIFDEVMVSSDDDEILEMGRRFGASVPFKRSAETSTDLAPTAPVVLEVIDEYRKRGELFDYVCCIYPAAPFVTAEKLVAAWKALEETGADGCLPIVRFSFPIWRSFKVENSRVAFNWPEHAQTRSQDLPPAFHDCGQFYFVRTSAFQEQKRLIMSNTVPLLVPETEVQDIDTEEDWSIAEIKYAARRSSRASPRPDAGANEALSLRPADMDDWARLYAWRNDATTREQSRDTAPVPLERHMTWLRETLGSGSAWLYIVTLGEPRSAIGTCRLNRRGAEAEVSVTIDPQVRGGGRTSAILRLLEPEARRMGIARLVATVRTGNAASLRAFASAGYTPVRYRDAEEIVELERHVAP